MVDKINPISKVIQVSKKVGRELQTPRLERKVPQSSFSDEVAAALARIDSRNDQIKNKELLLAKYDENKQKIQQIRDEIASLKRGNINDRIIPSDEGVHPDYMGQKINFLIG